MSKQAIRFLVADDHPFIRRIVQTALKGIDGAQLVEVGDGQQALFELGVVLAKPFPTDGTLPARDAISATRVPVDCVITDFNMPGVNGLEVLRMIRAGMTGVQRDLPVIMLTGFNDVPLLAAALSLDVNAFVTKPVAVRMLVDRVRQGMATPFPLKSKEEYGAVAIPMVGGEVPQRITDEASRPVSVNEPRQGTRGTGVETVPVSLLEEGTILAEDIRTKNDTLLLAEGVVLTASLINRLQELVGIVGIQTVQVIEPQCQAGS